jgi:CheY-like chemotaxis protein
MYQRSVTRPRIVNREILLVEDNEEYASTLAQIVEDLMHHSVTIARDGLEAVRLAQANKFDLFLLDVNLPKMKGGEVAKAIRQMERYNKVPIIAMTAYDDVQTRKQILASGCNLYLTKPIDIDALNDILNLYLQGLG